MYPELPEKGLEAQYQVKEVMCSGNKTINELITIFEKHKNERICVVGTMACGKTTLIKELTAYDCVDIDAVFWPLIPEKEIAVFSQRPLTTQLFDEICELMKEKISIKAGFPLFTVTIPDCEVVVYLDIPEELLAEHCNKRGDTNIEDALFVRQCIEDELSEQAGKTVYCLGITG